MRNFPFHKEESCLNNLKFLLRKSKECLNRSCTPCLLCGIIQTKSLWSEISFFPTHFIGMYQFCIVSENKGSLCFGFPLNFTQWSNLYYYITNIKIPWRLQLLFTLYKLRKLWERWSKVPGLDFKKSHAFPHMKKIKYNGNACEKKKCCTFSRYYNW